MNTLSKVNRDRLAKAFAIITAVTTVLSVSGAAYLTPIANAAVKPSDYGLKEGNTISAVGSNDPDVYIVNDWGFKRLFLNPVIFGFYGHLGGFANVKHVSAATRDAFVTSGLFRNCETNDQKVYGVEVTGEDTGMFHWVNMSGADAVAQDPDFFKKVFCINTNEANWYSKSPTNYTSLSQVPVYARAGLPAATPAPVAGSVNVSLASDNPGAATLTRSANGVAYLKLMLTGNGVVNQLKVYRQGPGATADFSNVYLYDGAKRLTSGRTPSSADGSVTFGSLNVTVNGSKELTVSADMSSATVGNVNYFAVNSANDVVLVSGTVGGSFPLTGSSMTVSGQTGGTITVANSGSLGNPNVGQTQVEVAEFKLTTATEGARVSRVQLINGGTIKTTDLNNLNLQVNGVQVATGYMISSGYAVFDFGSTPYFIAKGDNRIFKVYADVGGKKADTVDLYLEVTSDLLAVGDQFGFGVGVTNNFNNSTNSQTLTLQGGVLTLSFVGPSASNVSTTTTKTHFLDFDVNSAANIELRKHTIVFCMDDTGDGTFDSNADTTNGVPDLLNISIINRDTGVSLVGPADGSAFTTSNTTDCPNSATGAAKQFTDTFTMNAGQTLHLAVVGDVHVDSTTSETADIASGAVIKMIIHGYGTAVGSSGDLTIAKYSNTNTALTSSDIVPSGNISGNNLTVQGSSLALALAGTPTTGNHTFVKGTQNITADGFGFTTAQGNPVTVTSLTLSGYVADSGTTLKLGTGAAPDTALSVGGLLSGVRLVDGDTGTVIAANPTTNNLSNATGTAVFSNLSWAIPGGATKTLLVKTDLSTNAVSGSSDVFSFDIAATGDVSAIDQNSNSVSLGNAAVNLTTTPTTYVTVASAGSLTPAVAGDSPASSPLYWGQTGAQFSKFKFTSTNEGWYLERLNFYNSGVSNLVTQLVNNVDSETLTYTNKAGQTLTATAIPNSKGSVSFSFSSPLPGVTDARPYVPKDSSAYVAVSANIKTGAQLFRTSSASFSIDFSGGNGDEFRAVGDGSGAVIDGTGAGIADKAGNAQYVYRSFPVFTVLTPAGTTLTAGADVFKFRVDAMGVASDGATVKFDGATNNSSGSIKFAVLASGDSASSASLGFDLRRVVDGSGNSVDQLVATRTLAAAPRSGACTSAYNANCAADFNQNSNAGHVSSASFRFQDVAANQSIEIPAGQSNTFVIRLNAVTSFAKPVNTSGRAADFLQITLKNVAPNNTGEIFWTDNGGTDRNNSTGSAANILKNLPIFGPTIRVQ